MGTDIEPPDSATVNGAVSNRFPFSQEAVTDDGEFFRDTCGDPDKFQVWSQGQPLTDLVTGVGCEEDCRYSCMWLTVEEMEVSIEKIPYIYLNPYLLQKK